MFRQLIGLYVGFIVTMILAGMIVTAAKFHSSRYSGSSETLQISAIDPSEFRDLQHRGGYIELEGPRIRDLLQNNPFKEFPDESLTSAD